ncbi:hypothetical protein HPB47_000787 [Ixodes persulcatus]|uniref:Uncharacterized protein n=1 Tax=Ixodes persulcatus TaxID=34615 RepID=A0AC60PQU7_IXOPE|nr:hypothetical protein HPB47_000787 [Ixodes persulcatus]
MCPRLFSTVRHLIKENPESAPLILWLQGGPGSSSMIGLFTEHGPFVVDDDGNLKLREVTWTRRFSMLYVDNPVGTGFSFVEKNHGYARNQTDVGRDMLEALQQFFTLFHELANNEFYVMGESYAEESFFRKYAWRTTFHFSHAGRRLLT